MSSGYELKTLRGYDFGEVVSALQKSIRRGLEKDALYWAVELDKSGFSEYVWKRIKIMTSEDVGIAEPNMPANISGLYQMWLDQKKKKDEKHAPERLFLVHAVILLSRARKSRIVDHALCIYYNSTERIEIPDFALDKHTLAGKKMGRGFDHFFAEGIKLNNEADIKDEYLEMAKKVMINGRAETKCEPEQAKTREVSNGELEF